MVFGILVSSICFCVVVLFFRSLGWRRSSLVDYLVFELFCGDVVAVVPSVFWVFDVFCGFEVFFKGHC